MASTRKTKRIRLPKPPALLDGCADRYYKFWNFQSSGRAVRWLAELTQLPRNAAIDNKLQRINEQIRITPIRVVDQNGHMHGVIPTLDALQLAREAGLDLVEVSPNERPPVCRIMDFGKFKYEQKKKHTANTKTHQTQLKEIRLRPKTGEHDIEFKVKQARTFLEHKDKVKVNVQFKGRENAHHERGREVLEHFVAGLEDIAKIEQIAKMDGAKNMSVVLAPR